MERPSVQNKKIASLIDNMEKVIVGKHSIIELMITSLLSGGHVLIEDVPGVGKTKMVSALSASCGGVFSRIQMTPDVMPSDITGFMLINQNTKELEFKKGAAFCNFLLADEINRSSPKSQSALLELMEEGQVSIDGVTHKLPEPFMVLATQNPVETYGTYHLPEAQMDRFMMELSIGYPDKDSELEILKRDNKISVRELTEVLSVEDIMGLKREVQEVFCSERIEKFIIDIAHATRHMEGILLGVSPRGSIALLNAAKAYAYICGRSYVIPDDVKYLAPFVLAHRLILNPQGKSRWRSKNDVVADVMLTVKAPVE